MRFVILFLLISLSLTQYQIYIKNIYPYNIDENGCSDNDIILFFNIICGQSIPENLKKENVFEINIQSENFNDNEKIIFNCDLFGPTNSEDAFIKCNLKEKIVKNFEKPFYFKKIDLEKSFIINYENETLNFTLGIMEQPYKIGIIKQCENNPNKKYIKFNFIYSNPYDIISITMALDDRYLYPTLVSMTSILETRNKTTKYDFYIMHPHAFQLSNKKKLLSFNEKYKYSTTVNLIDMQTRFIKAKKDRHIKTPAYYRLSLSTLLPFIDRIIWLDGDTITFKDLKEMYDLDMDNLNYRGFLDIPNQLDHITKENDHNICSGVLLINLKNLRKENMVDKYERFIEKYNKKLRKHDQTVINCISFDKIGVLEAKYGIFNYRNKKILRRKQRILGSRSKYQYSWKEILEAYENPTILHCVKKVWKKLRHYKSGVWWDFAMKCDYFEEICKKYPGPCKTILKKHKIKNKELMNEVIKRRKIEIEEENKIIMEKQSKKKGKKKKLNKTINDEEKKKKKKKGKKKKRKGKKNKNKTNDDDEIYGILNPKPIKN